MYLTQHELTAASSAVAALAILGGYLGVRSANRNALKIAREERSSRHRAELEALKRVTYAKFLTVLTALASASQEQEAIIANTEIRGDTRIAAIKKRADALTAAQNMFAELELFAPDLLRELARDSLECAGVCTRKNSPAFTQGAAKLRFAMRYDLQSPETSPEELNRITSGTIAAPPPNPQGEHSAATPSARSASESSDTSTSPAKSTARAVRSS